MRSESIRRMIRSAVQDEMETGRLANCIREFGRQNGVRPAKAQVDQTVDWVRQYIEHVPIYLEQAQTAGECLGLAAEIGQMLGELEAYWFEANDLVPDHLGLQGLADDAYATLILLQGMSDYCQSTFSRPLLTDNLRDANKNMRLLLGEPVASILDQRVGITIGNAMLHRVLGQIVNTGFIFPSAPATDPMYGNASINDIVNAKLGSMGVV
jgi:hypothetical protein